MYLYNGLSYMLVQRWFEVSKISLYVATRKHSGGRYIASIPMRKLVELSKCHKKRWTFKDDWLILEAGG